MSQKSFFQALPGPTILYKYRALSSEKDWERLERLLIDGKAWFSSASQLNDLFECKPEVVFHATTEQKMRYIRKLLKKEEPSLKHKELKTLTQQYYKQKGGFSEEFRTYMEQQMHKMLERDIGILCLSANPDHPLMWSHYADSHKGICIGLKCDPDASNFLAATYKVSYVDEFPVVNPIKDNSFKITENMVLTKGSDWKYEAEWRALVHTTGSGEYELPENSVDSIVIGARLPTFLVTRLNGIIQQMKNIPSIFEVSPMQGKFLFELRELRR